MVLRELLARFGVDFDASPLRRGMGAIDSVVGSIGQLGRALAGSAIIAAGLAFVSSITEWADGLGDVAERLGLTSTELREWQHAAQLSGLEAEQMQGALARLAAQAGRAAQDGGAMAGVFRRLGVDVRGADGQLRPVSDLMMSLADGFAGVENETEKAALATRLFGRSGVALVPLLSRGSAGIAELREEVRSLFGTDLEGLTAQAGRVDDAMHRWDLVMEALRTTIALEILPIVGDMITTIVAWGRAFLELARGTNIVRVGLIALAAVAAVTAVALLLPFIKPLIIFALLAAAVALVVLIVDDLISLFTGGRSVIGQWIDQFFGAGTAARTVEQIRDAAEDVMDAIRASIPTIMEWVGRFQAAGELILEGFQRTLPGVIAWISRVISRISVMGSHFIRVWGPALLAAGRFFAAFGGQVIRFQVFVVRLITGLVRIFAGNFARLVRTIGGAVQSLARVFGIDLGQVARSFDQFHADLARGALDFGTRAVAVGERNLARVEQNNTIGQILVQGAPDPEETAQRVINRIEERRQDNMRAAQAALATEGT